jgi:TonB family protein
VANSDDILRIADKSQRPAWPRALRLALVAAFFASTAAAQGDVVAPKLESDPGVSYPKQALAARQYERVEVVLVIEIDQTGAVGRATVETPRGHGFDEAALEAAKRLKFTPAERAGKPAASRIKFRYVFEPPPAGLGGRVSDASTGKALSGARVVVRAADGSEHTAITDPSGNWALEAVPRGKATVAVEADAHAAQAVDVTLTPGSDAEVVFRLVPSAAATTEPTPGEPPLEVTVHGEKPAPSVKSFSREEVRQMPGAFGDPFRAIEAMPGVTPLASGLPFFFVRGAPAGNVGYFLDGVRVPFLYHVGIGPSVIHPGVVERVDLYSGGYPARFGRFAGGIVAAETTAPRVDLHGEGNLRLFDAGALVETGFANGRGTVLVGGRYSYTATLLSLVASNLELAYRDYQVRVSYDVTPRDRLSLFSFGSYDLLGEKKGDELMVLFGTEFYRLDLRHDHDTGKGSLRTAVTFGLDLTKNEFLAGEQRTLRTRSLGVRDELEHRFGDDVVVRAGADLTLENFSISRPKYVDPDDPESRAFDQAFTSRNDLALGVRTDFVLDVTPEIEVIPGARIDLYRSGSASAVGVDPRIAARFSVSDRVTLTHAYGIAHQPPSFALPIPGLTPANLQGGLQRSFQTSAGVEVDVADATTASMTLFHNAFFNMSDSIGSAAGGGPPSANPPRSMGSSIGAELLVKRNLSKRLGGFLSYTLSRSSRSLGREKFPSNVDRTHVLNAALGYNLGRGWRPGARAVFYTGTPKERADAGQAIREPRTENVERGSPFFRLDLRLEKRWVLGETTWLSFVAEVLNSTLSKETFGDSEIGPVTIPSVGVEGGF